MKLLASSFLGFYNVSLDQSCAESAKLFSLLALFQLFSSLAHYKVSLLRIVIWFAGRVVLSIGKSSCYYKKPLLKMLNIIHFEHSKGYKSAYSRLNWDASRRNYCFKFSSYLAPNFFQFSSQFILKSSPFPSKLFWIQSKFLLNCLQFPSQLPFKSLSLS